MQVARLLVLSAVFTAAAVAGQESAWGQAGATTPAPSDITPTEEPASSPWGWLKKPSITMPKLSFPKMPADPLAPIKTSARKVGDGARKAWEGTKELFTLGGSKKDAPSARMASAGEAPSVWDRMFGGEEPKNEGPATVGEWMSQPRVE
ncbi:MAG TPA: hypothetical protein VF175_14195 [Lacipirellula sp.]